MLTLMVGTVEDVFLSIFMWELTTQNQISISSLQIHRKCFNTHLVIFCSLLISSEECWLVYRCFQVQSSITHHGQNFCFSKK
jgi:hypothetical protein